MTKRAVSVFFLVLQFNLAFPSLAMSFDFMGLSPEIRLKTVEQLDNRTLRELRDIPELKPLAQRVTILRLNQKLRKYSRTQFTPFRAMADLIKKPENSELLATAFHFLNHLTDLRDQNGLTLLHIAAHVNNGPVVNSLVEINPALLKSSADGKLALDLITWIDDWSIIANIHKKYPDIFHTVVQYDPGIPSSPAEQIIALYDENAISINGPCFLGVSVGNFDVVLHFSPESFMMLNTDGMLPLEHYIFIFEERYYDYEELHVDFDEVVGYYINLFKNIAEQIFEKLPDAVLARNGNNELLVKLYLEKVPPKINSYLLSIFLPKDPSPESQPSDDYYEVLDAILAHADDCWQVSEDKSSLIHICIRNRRYVALDYFLTKNPNLASYRDSLGRDALAFARATDDSESVAIILKHLKD